MLASHIFPLLVDLRYYVNILEDFQHFQTRHFFPDATKNSGNSNSTKHYNFRQVI